MHYCQYYCDSPTIALWLKHRMKHTSSRGPYLSSGKAANSVSLFSLYSSCSSLQLWNDAPIFVLVFSLAWLILCFYTAFFISRIISSLRCGQWCGILLLCCLAAIIHNLTLGLNVSDKVRTVTALGRGTASRVCTRVIDTSQTLPLALIGCVDLGAVNSCKSNYSHWVEPLSDHHNLSNNNKKIVRLQL